MEHHTITAVMPDGSEHDITAALKARAARRSTATPDESEFEHVQERTTQELRKFIERVANLEEQKSAIAADIKDVLDAAKGQGFSAKTIKEIIKIRKVSLDEFRQERELLDLYAMRLGIPL